MCDVFLSLYPSVPVTADTCTARPTLPVDWMAAGVPGEHGLPALRAVGMGLSTGSGSAVTLPLRMGGGAVQERRSNRGTVTPCPVEVRAV